VRALWVAPTRREAAALPAGAAVATRGAELQERLAGGGFDVVVIAGVCGGLDPSLSAGDLVLARGVASVGDPSLRPPPPLLERARATLRATGRPFVTAGLLTVDAPVASVAAKRRLWNAHAAAAVDMETHALAAAALAAGSVWLAVRAVVDPAGLTLPAPLTRWQGDAESAIVGRLARRPQDWPAILRLALAMRRAVESLRRAAMALDSLLIETDAEQLALPEPEPSRELPLLNP
jgi:adenosylhomocysteine nucleosidase